MARMSAVRGEINAVRTRPHWGRKPRRVTMRARLCMLGMLLLATPAEAQFARQEVHPFQSADTPAADFLAGKKGAPITLAGYLRAPKAPLASIPIAAIEKPR